jgi:hypothetical protein
MSSQQKKRDLIKSSSSSKLADYLDSLIEAYFKGKKEYPSRIQMSEVTKNKLWEELKTEHLDLSWYDQKIVNYKGILIEFINEQEIRLI